MREQRAAPRSAVCYVVTDATAEIDPELLKARVVHTTDVNGGAETTRYVCGVESVCAEVRAWMLSLTAEP